jgi:hypothetical protein
MNPSFPIDNPITGQQWTLLGHFSAKKMKVFWRQSRVHTAESSIKHQLNQGDRPSDAPNKWAQAPGRYVYF